MASIRLFCLIFSSIFAFQSELPIVRWIHGINAPCSSSTLEKEFKDFDFKCIQTDVSSKDRNSFDQQIQAGCDELQKEIENLKKGFTLFGVSQGGLIARGILQRCEAGKYIKRLISMGAPHSGIAIVPFTSPNNPINAILVRACYIQASTKYVGPCSYMRSLRYYEEYKSSHVTIFDLNNEGQVNPQYIERIKSLDLFMAIGFNSDKMVQPKTTSIFGFYKDEKYKELVEMETTEIYQQNRIGLRELEEKGKLFRCMVEGSHLSISLTHLRKMIVDFSDVSSEKYKENYAYLKEFCKFRE